MARERFYEHCWAQGCCYSYCFFPSVITPCAFDVMYFTFSLPLCRPFQLYLLLLVYVIDSMLHLSVAGSADGNELIAIFWASTSPSLIGDINV